MVHPEVFTVQCLIPWCCLWKFENNGTGLENGSDHRQSRRINLFLLTKLMT